MAVVYSPPGYSTPATCYVNQMVKLYYAHHTFNPWTSKKLPPPQKKKMKFKNNTPLRPSQPTITHKRTSTLYYTHTRAHRLRLDLLTVSHTDLSSFQFYVYRK